TGAGPGGLRAGGRGRHRSRADGDAGGAARRPRRSSLRIERRGENRLSCPAGHRRRRGGGASPMKRGLAGRIGHAWIDSKLTPLVIASSLLLGLFSLWKLPREEEPQIIVPMIDVMVGMPGAS